jgi:hypothetical protein
LRASAAIPASALTAATTTSHSNRRTSIATSSHTKYAASGIHSGSTIETTNERPIATSSTRAT